MMGDQPKIVMNNEKREVQFSNSSLQYGIGPLINGFPFGSEIVCTKRMPFWLKLDLQNKELPSQ